MNVLIVDDDRALLEILQNLLQEEGHQVTAVSSAYDALDEMGRQQFDLALVDLKMRRMDGLELLESEKLRNPQVRMVIMTAYATVETAVVAMRRGAFDYLVKPFKLADLRAVINRAAQEKERAAARRTS